LNFYQWQKEARNAMRGLWANPNPVAPWEFKRKGKGRNRKNRGRTKSQPKKFRTKSTSPIQAY
jgi:hypothetical protein